MTHDTTPRTPPCGFCGQRVEAQEWHTFLHCTLHKAGVKPADYGITLQRAEAAEPAPLDALDWDYIGALIGDALNYTNDGAVIARAIRDYLAAGDKGSE